MSGTTQTPGVDRVGETAVRGVTRFTFLAASLVFLVTIGLGFLNIVTSAALPRWQVLTHLHSGTVGWILLSYVGIAIWLFTGDRPVSAAYERRLKWFVWLATAAFVGLVASFAYGYSQGGDNALLPLGIFAPLAAAVIWATAIFAVAQLRRLAVVTTPHLVVAVGLLGTAIGVTLGAWLGLENAVGGLLPVTHDMGTGAHVLSALPAVTVVATGVIEWLTDTGERTRWSRSGALQAAIGGLTGLMLPIGFSLLAIGVPEETAGVVFLGLIVGTVLYTLLFLARVGWRALWTNPLNGGIGAWLFFATLWFVVFMASEFAGTTLGEADWVIVLRVHSVFIGVMANLLFGVIVVQTSVVKSPDRWAAPAAMWLLNAGIVIFVVVEAAMGVSHGAAVMGVGLLLGVGTMIHRLQADGVDAAEPTGRSVS